jgi:hypothetical protein
VTYQPRSDIYQNTIDNLVVLVKGGLTAYSGPRNQVEQIMREAGHPIPPLFNPADFLLDLVSVDVRGAKEIETRERVQNLVQFWRGREPPLERDKSQYETIGESNLLVQTGKRESQITPFYIAFPVVLERMVKNLCAPSPVHLIRSPYSLCFAAGGSKLYFGFVSNKLHSSGFCSGCSIND